MSSFWSWWITIIAVGNILACYWLIKWASKRRPGEAEVGEVTGHKWDETLEEYNNPLPRWWLWMFYGTIVFGLVYLFLYPGLGNWPGKLGWTSHGQYEKEMEQAKAKYDPIFAAFASKPIEELAKDPAALKVGERLFLNYCASCHGSTASGAPGFPNLTDNDWLWGGDPETIKTTILDGRQGAMPAWGPILGADGVDKVAEYVLSLSGRSHDPDKAAAGKEIFQNNCAACHGPDGKGNPAMGAPNLTDNVWLYGGSPGTIRQTITRGRNGRMPAHRDFLGENKVHVLAAYVYSLSHR